MSWRPLIPLLLGVSLAACETKELVIEANTAWAGSISGYGLVAGEGNAVVDLTDAPSQP